MERSVIFHGSKETFSLRDYFRWLVAIEKIWQPFSFGTSTKRTEELGNLQNASRSNYTKFHLKTNTCNFEHKIKC